MSSVTSLSPTSSSQPTSRSASPSASPSTSRPAPRHLAPPTSSGSITTIGLDADDTLWHNEDGFHRVEQRFVEIVRPSLPSDSATLTDAEILSALAERERNNVTVFGYGVKSFTFSMIETAVALSHGTIPSDRLTLIIDEGRQLLTRPTELLDGVQETLAKLGTMFRLVLVTKGDHHHQRAKLDESGLARWFSAVEVVSEKDIRTYERIVSEHADSTQRFAMVGNSVKSDVLPVLELGSTAVHIPYRFTWALEQAAVEAHHVGSGRFFELTALAELPALMADLESTSRQD
jgi:putative hydrolase of the HAD superfamily